MNATKATSATATRGVWLLAGACIASVRPRQRMAAHANTLPALWRSGALDAPRSNI